MLLPNLKIRPISNRDRDDVLDLNTAHETQTAPLDKDALNAFLAISFYTGAIGRLDGFCIAMDQDAGYDSPNFKWFKAHYERFIYVDRIIVAANARGRGVAGALYKDLFSAARRAGHSVVCCEVNINPPNPGSGKFHTRLGFTRIGKAKLPGPDKTVGYWIRNI